MTPAETSKIPTWNAIVYAWKAMQLAYTYSTQTGGYVSMDGHCTDKVKGSGAHSQSAENLTPHLARLYR